MADMNSPKSTPAGNPDLAGTPSHQFDQMAILQALGEIQKDVATLTERTSGLADGIKDARDDMRDVRDRLRAAEVKIDHLPGKGFIVAVVVTALIFLGALFGFQEEIQTFFGRTPN